MNLHLSIDNIFMDKFISNANKYSKSKNIYFIFSESEKLKHIKDNNIVVLPFQADAFKSRFEELRDINQIYFHSLIPLWSVLTEENNLQKNRKLIWIFYGFEIFELHRYKNSLLLTETLKHLEKSSVVEKSKVKLFSRDKIKSFINSYSNHKIISKREFPIISLIKKISVVAHFIYDDYNEYIKPINSKIKYLEWNYMGSLDLEHTNQEQNNEPRKALNILLGNSGSFFNNHFDGLNIIEKSIDKSVIENIVVPLNYSAEPEYIIQLDAYGKKKFGEKFKPILNLMTPTEYYNLLYQIDIAVFCNIRSQAAANINWLLLNGTPIFMHEKSTLYKSYTQNNFTLYKLQELFNIDKIITKNLQTKKSNIQAMEKTFGESAMKIKYQNLLDKM